MFGAVTIRLGDTEIEHRPGLAALLQPLDRGLALRGQLVELDNGLGHSRQGLLPEAGDFVHCLIDVGKGPFQRIHVQHGPCCLGLDRGPLRFQGGRRARDQVGGRGVQGRDLVQDDFLVGQAKGNGYRH